MNQPPPAPDRSARPPDWRRPRGVAAGTWHYVNERSIANRYDEFVADSPLCNLDLAILNDQFPATDREPIVLDLGCGSGRAAIPLSTRGYRVIGIDLSQAMLEVMMAKQPPSDRIMPIRCNLVDLDCLSDQSADHAICLFSTLGMIHGSRHRQRLLRHVARIVRPGGRLVVHVHNRWAGLREVRGIRTLAAGWIRARIDRDFEFGDSTYQYRGLEKMFMHRYSRRELVADLSGCGWGVDRLATVSIDGATLSDRRGIAGGYIAVGVRLPT